MNSANEPTEIRDASLASTQIPGHRMVRLLGRGGMGEVYLGIDENLNRSVAIKLINSEFSKNTESLERFIREGRIIAGFNHPSIVAVYASNWTGTPYIVMEYVEGGSLADRIRNGPLSQSAAILVGERMADALAYAHKRDVIHRDFKPGNILMREDETPVLSDFGIAKSLDASGVRTEYGAVFGSPRYIAPEQGLDSSNLTDRSDVYSFGLVLHEMLTQELPNHPVRSPAEVGTIIRRTGKPLGELIGRCLDLKPDARPSAGECQILLEVLSRQAQSGTAGWRLAAMIGAGVAAAGTLAWIGGAVMHSPAASKSNTVAAAVTQGSPQASTQSALLPLTLSTVPASARTFVDNNEAHGSSLKLSTGDHQIVAIAPHYFGQSKRVRLEAGSSVPSVSLALDPTSLPTGSELERFSQLADSKALSEREVTELSDRTFQTVLRAKFLNENRETADLGVLIASIEELRRFGDWRAAVAAFLLDSVHAGHVGRAQVTQSLADASNEGDAMASLFLAVSYRDAMSQVPSGVTPTDAMFRQYCDRLRLASRQGWNDVAAEYQQRDHCVDGNPRQ